MAASSVPLFLALFGAFVGALGGLITGRIVRRAAPTWPGISLRWIAAGWAAAWATGLGMTVALLIGGAATPDTSAMATALGVSAIGGIGGGVTFWQIEQARRRSLIATVETTTAQPKARPLAASITRPIIVVCGGWIVSWVAGVTWAQTSPVSLTVRYASWAAVSLITGLVLRRIAPAMEWKRIGQIAIGWPLCLIIGMAAQYNWTLPVGVAACGWLAASTLLPPLPGRYWLYRGVAAAAWAASWLVVSSIAWEIAQHAMMGSNIFFPLSVPSILGAILSGVIGGRVLYTLFERARHELSTTGASARPKTMLDKTIARPIVVIGGGWIVLWALAAIVAQSFFTAEDSIAAVRASWIAVSLLTGFVLYRVAPNVQKYALLIAIGWPPCLLIGTAIMPPTVTLTLPLAVVVCGLLAAWALTLLMPSIGWLQRLLAAGVWAGCWLISSDVWITALWVTKFTGRRLAEFTGGPFTTFFDLTSGAIVSGVLGSIVLYWLIDDARRKAVGLTSQSE